MNRRGSKSWDVVAALDVYDSPPWIKVVKQEVRLPTGRVIEDYHRVELPDCIIIFAQTEDDLVIVERSYQHGVGEEVLILPAGLIDQNEAPLDAARRELLEETGYASDRWQALGSYVAHGNYGCGRVHIFQAGHARLVAMPDSEDLEDMEIVLMTLPALMDAVTTNEVCTMGTMATIALATNSSIRFQSESGGATGDSSRGQASGTNEGIGRH